MGPLYAQGRGGGGGGGGGVPHDPTVGATRPPRPKNLKAE